MPILCMFSPPGWCLELLDWCWCWCCGGGGRGEPVVCFCCAHICLYANVFICVCIYIYIYMSIQVYNDYQEERIQGWRPREWWFVGEEAILCFCVYACMCMQFSRKMVNICTCRGVEINACTYMNMRIHPPRVPSWCCNVVTLRLSMHTCVCARNVRTCIIGTYIRVCVCVCCIYAHAYIHIYIPMLIAAITWRNEYSAHVCAHPRGIHINTCIRSSYTQMHAYLHYMPHRLDFVALACAGSLKTKVHTCVHSPPAYGYVCVCVVHIYIYIYIYKHTYIHTYIHVYIHECKYLYIRISYTDTHNLFVCLLLRRMPHTCTLMRDIYV